MWTYLEIVVEIQNEGSDFNGRMLLPQCDLDQTVQYRSLGICQVQPQDCKFSSSLTVELGEVRQALRQDTEENLGLQEARLCRTAQNVL